MEWVSIKNTIFCMLLAECWASYSSSRASCILVSRVLVQHTVTGPCREKKVQISSAWESKIYTLVANVLTSSVSLQHWHSDHSCSLMDSISMHLVQSLIPAKWYDTIAEIETNAYALLFLNHS